MVVSVLAVHPQHLADKLQFPAIAQCNQRGLVSLYITDPGKDHSSKFEVRFLLNVWVLCQSKS